MVLVHVHYFTNIDGRNSIVLYDTAKVYSQHKIKTVNALSWSNVHIIIIKYKIGNRYVFKVGNINITHPLFNSFIIVGNYYIAFKT